MLKELVFIALLAFAANTQDISQDIAMLTNECFQVLIDNAIEGIVCEYDEPTASYISTLYFILDFTPCAGQLTEIAYLNAVTDTVPSDPPTPAEIADWHMFEIWPFTSEMDYGMGYWVITYSVPMAKVDELIVDGWATIENHVYQTELTETKEYWFFHEWLSPLGGQMKWTRLSVKIHVTTDMNTNTANFDVTATEIEKLCPGACCVLEYCEVFITPTATAEFTDSTYNTQIMSPQYEFGDEQYMRIFIDDVNFRNERRLMLEAIQLMSTNFGANPPFLPDLDWSTTWDVSNAWLTVYIIGTKMGEGTYHYMLYLSLCTESLFAPGTWYKLDGDSNPIEVPATWVETRRLQGGDEKYAVYRQETQKVTIGQDPSATTSSNMPMIIGGAVILVVLLGIVGGLVWKSGKKTKQALPTTVTNAV